MHLVVAHNPGGVHKLVALKAPKEEAGVEHAREEIFAEARVATLLTAIDSARTFCSQESPNALSARPSVGSDQKRAREAR